MSDAPSADLGLDPSLLAAASSATEPAAVTAPPAAPGAPGAMPVPQTPEDWINEARALWSLVRMQKMRWPSVGNVYTTDAIEELAHAWAPVLQKHNITAGKYMIYLVAAGATLPILEKNVEAIREDRAAAAAEKAAKAAAAPPPAA